MVSEVQKRDLSLFPGSYAYIQDGSKGTIKVLTGPTTTTLSAQDTPVRYDKAQRGFVVVERLEDAVQKSSVAVEGYYIELLNPAKDGSHPNEGSNQNGSDLLVGRKVNIIGPAMFPLWPGQVATVIRGHHLRSNQYLLCRVYNEEEARKHWGESIVKLASKLTPPAADAKDEEKKAYETALATEKAQQAKRAEPPADLTSGKLFVVEGTDVSFYIPPTGITVVEEGLDGAGKPIFVRDALTLERMEYAVLVAENGKKRYEKGPAVVFPLPTERFMQTSDGAKKHRAQELNELHGIHVKVTADYQEGGGKQFKAGEELFITGKDTPIYYPREEHAILRYDGHTKHYATAIPAGEGRYVLERMEGIINKVVGPAMLLPDPRKQVIVRRVLSARQCEDWYPGNQEVQQYNASLRSLTAHVPTTRTGMLSEGDATRGLDRTNRQKSKGDNFGTVASVYASNANFMMDSSVQSKDVGFVGDELVRSATYTEPRTITLNNKFQGIPGINVWTGYAVMVVSTSGKRRVEIGPTTVLLDYDETLEIMALSTGKPKNTDTLFRTAYLGVENNKVSDIINVETVDHVQVEVKLSYNVNFEGEEKEKWFAVSNYVKFLCDHVRSIVKGSIRKTKIEDFYANSTDILRDLILGKVPANGERSGLLFEANNMRVADVEILGVVIKDDRIRTLLENTQHEVVKTNLEMASLRRDLEITSIREDINRKKSEETSLTTQKNNELMKISLLGTLEVNLSRLDAALREAQQNKEVIEAQIENTAAQKNADLTFRKTAADLDLSIEKQRQEQKIEFLVAETKATVDRLAAVDEHFSKALLTLSDHNTIKTVAEAWGIQRIIGGDSLSEALAKAFPSGPLAGIAKALGSGTIPLTTNGASKPAEVAKQ